MEIWPYIKRNNYQRIYCKTPQAKMENHVLMYSMYIGEIQIHRYSYMNFKCTSTYLLQLRSQCLICICLLYSTCSQVQVLLPKVLLQYIIVNLLFAMLNSYCMFQWSQLVLMVTECEAWFVSYLLAFNICILF